MLRVVLRLKWMIWTNQTLIHCFDSVLHRFRNRTAIIYHGEKYSYQTLDDLANKISNWFENCLQLGCDDEYEQQQEELKKQQQSKNDDNSSSNVLNIVRRHQNSIKIGLMFSNVPELASFLIGICRVRCAAVLFNYNHRNDLLLNAFEASNCKMFIFESKYLPALKEIADRLPDGIRFIMYDRNIRNDSGKHEKNLDYKGFTRDDLINGNILENDEKFSQILDSYPVTRVRKNYTYKMNDIIAYIFTSGTTGGKIKAAAVNNYRFVAINLLMYFAFGIDSKENVYVCVPIYHGLGCIMGIGSTFINGNITTLVDKFSASKFWKDCYENKCTVSVD